MLTLIYVVAALLGAVQIRSDDWTRAMDRARITIIDTGKPIPVRRTYIDVGPETGNILNVHYFPGINLFNAGRYVDAEENMTYLLDRPFYIADNPRKEEFLSTACY